MAKLVLFKIFILKTKNKSVQRTHEKDKLDY